MHTYIHTGAQLFCAGVGWLVSRRVVVEVAIVCYLSFCVFFSLSSSAFPSLQNRQRPRSKNPHTHPHPSDFLFLLFLLFSFFLFSHTHTHTHTQILLLFPPPSYLMHPSTYTHALYIK
jgi:hypothetical protein